MRGFLEYAERLAVAAGASDALPASGTLPANSALPASGRLPGNDELSPREAVYAHDAIAQSVCTQLEKRGYRTQRNVGASRTKVDIAVMDPHDETRYVAGILLDGASYSAARSTRDRELGRKEQLKDLGWNIMHLWSLDYLFDESRCIERVTTRLDQLCA